MRPVVVALVLSVSRAAVVSAAPSSTAQAIKEEKSALLSEIQSAMAALKSTAADEDGSQVIGLYIRAGDAPSQLALYETRRDFEAWRKRVAKRSGPPARMSPAQIAQQRQAAARATENQIRASRRAGSIAPGFPSAGTAAASAVPLPRPRPPLGAASVPASASMVREGLLARGADPVVLDIVGRVSARERVDPAVLFGLIRRETNLKRQDRCLRSSAKEPAIGRLQIKLSTARDYGIDSANQLCDTETNVTVAARHLKRYADGANLAHVNPLDERVKLAIARYYAGTGTIAKGMKGALTGYWERYNWRHAWDVYVPSVEGFIDEMRGAKNPPRG